MREEAHDAPQVALGDLVRVTGKVSNFKGYKNIWIMTMCKMSLLCKICQGFFDYLFMLILDKESDPNVEILHWLQTIELKKTHYNKPFTLPPSFYEQ